MAGPTDQVKIHAFKVETANAAGDLLPLEDLLEQIQSDNLSNRVRQVERNTIRLEAVQQHSSGYWLMDFGRRRDKRGPGKADHKTPIEGFEFGEGQTFWEETAALFDPAQSALLVEYNHFGARAGAIQAYLTSYRQIEETDIADLTVYNLQAVYDHGAERRFRNRKATKWFEFKIKPQILQESDYKPRGVALRSAVRFSSSMDAADVYLRVSAGKARKRLLGGSSKDDLQELHDLVNEEPEALSKLKVRMLELDDTLHTVDLIEERLSQTFNLPVDVDKRVPRSERWGALERALNGWKNSLK